MVLGILLLFSNFYCTAGKLKWYQSLWGSHSSLDFEGSEEVDCNLLVVVLSFCPWYDRLLLIRKSGYVLVWSCRTLWMEQADALFQR